MNFKTLLAIAALVGAVSAAGTGPHGSPMCDGCTVTGTGGDNSLWGWENEAACEIDTSKCGDNPSPPAGAGPHGQPLCSGCTVTSTGGDDSLWGWENEAACEIDVSKCGTSGGGASAPAQPAQPAQQPQTQQAPTQQAPTKQLPSQQAPVQQAPVQQTPATKVPNVQVTKTLPPQFQGQAPQAPVQQAPVQQAPTTKVPNVQVTKTIPPQAYSDPLAFPAGNSGNAGAKAIPDAAMTNNNAPVNKSPLNGGPNNAGAKVIPPEALTNNNTPVNKSPLNGGPSNTKQIPAGALTNNQPQNNQPQNNNTKQIPAGALTQPQNNQPQNNQPPQNNNTKQIPAGALTQPQNNQPPQNNNTKQIPGGALTQPQNNNTPPTNNAPAGGAGGAAPNLKVIGEKKTGKTTRYWDCCKPSCAWSGKANVSSPVGTCSADGSKISDVDAKSGCDGGNSYMCTDQQPWAINDQLSYGFAAASISGGSESTWCCACYRLTFTSTSIAGKQLVVQVTNTGGDLGENHFDLQMPGGGLGIFDGCSAQFGVDASSWGERYGGLSAAAECSKLPASLQKGCEWRFGWFENADNPSMEFEEVECPAELTQKTGCVRR